MPLGFQGWPNIEKKVSKIGRNLLAFLLLDFDLCHQLSLALLSSILQGFSESSLGSAGCNPCARGSYSAAQGSAVCLLCEALLHAQVTVS